MNKVSRTGTILASGFLLALAGCGTSDGETQVTTVGGEEGEEPQTLTPVDSPPEVEAPALAAIARADIEAELEPGAGCSIEDDGKSLLVAVEGDAIARPYGTLRHLEFDGDLNALWDGGEFTAGAITITVTPDEGEGERIDEVTTRPARVVVRDAGQTGEYEMRVEWACGA